MEKTTGRECLGQPHKSGSSAAPAVVNTDGYHPNSIPLLPKCYSGFHLLHQRPYAPGLNRTEPAQFINPAVGYSRHGNPLATETD